MKTLDALDPTLVRTAHAVLARHGRTFRMAGRFLPRRRRDAAAVIYAFCRHVDDLVDESSDRLEAHDQLAQLEAALFDESTPDPLLVALRQVVRKLAIDPGVFHELIAGVRSDLEEAVALADDAALLRYSYRVAGTVGLMMSAVLGVREREAAAPFAIDLGIGMQLTNICRDVREDAQRGRVYLPATRLAAVGLDAEAVCAGLGAARVDSSLCEKLWPVVVELLGLAERYYASGLAGIGHIPRRPRLAIYIAATGYRAIGRTMQRRNAEQALGQRTIVVRAAKAACVLRGITQWATQAPSRNKPHNEALHATLAGLPGANA